MLKKSIPLLVALLAPALLTGCPVYVDTLGGYSTFGSPDIVVVGASVPADIEYSQPTYTTGNGDGNPLIDSFTQNIPQVKQGQPVTFTVVAHDPNKRPLQFNWSSTGGTLSTNTGRVVSWDPPEGAGIYTVTVVISNGNGGVAAGSLNLTVHPGAAPASPPPEATPAPIATPRPGVSVTPRPLPLPLPTPAPEATSIPTPLPTPSPTPTAAATVAPTQTPSPARSAGPSAISGVVKDSVGLLAGTEVVLTSSDPNIPFVASITTGADGSYHFVNVPPNINMVLSARKDGYNQGLRAISSAQGQETVWSFDGNFKLVRQQ
jgi:hypothetical protein